MATDANIPYLEAIISDRGRGIGNLHSLLQRKPGNTVKGSGIINSRKLVDFFDIESEFEKGTKVTLRQRLPHNAPILSKAIADAWIQDFDQEIISPYAEIKRQNMQLLELLEHLRERSEVTQLQLQEIRNLNGRLQQSNQDIKELLEERERQNILLQKINNDLNAFAHTVSHDLRAPLQNINGLSSALEDCVNANKLAEAKELFPMLNNQAARMDNFITSILAYSLAERNHIQKDEVHVYQLVQEVLELLGIVNSLMVKASPQLPVLETEKILLHQVFSNLLSNAIKYHDMQVEPVVEICCSQRGNLLQFSVIDNGPGIEPLYHQQIFEIYSTIGKNEGNSTGIGLSIVKKIVNGKGGDIWVESAGRGSRFVFTWPAEELVLQ